MRLATFDNDRIGLVEGQEIFDVTSVLDGSPDGPSSMRRLIRDWDRVDVRSAARQPRPLSEVQLHAPVPDPSKIFAAPVNYRDHQAEMSQVNHISTMGLFLKAPSSVLDPDGTIQLPYSDRRFDQEGELACIIGRRTRRVSEEDALSHVFGYTGLLDITMRGGEDRSNRKSFETFTPMGPWLVTADEIVAPDDVALRCWVTGGLRQDASTADLIWGVAKLVSYASWVTTLEPGDVIATGTPAGVGPLEHGDTIELQISGLGGRLRAGVSTDGAVPSHTDGKSSGPKPPPAPSGAGRGN